MKPRARVVVAGAFVLSLLAGFSNAAGGAHRHRRHKDRWMLLLRPGLSADENRRVVGELGLGQAVDVFQQVGLVVIDAPEADRPAHFARVKNHPQVTEVEEDFYANWLEGEAAPVTLASVWSAARAMSTTMTMNRTEAESFVASQEPQERVPWGIARVHAPEAWSRNQGGGVRVAVIDSGIDCSHPDLQCDLGAGINVLDPGALPMDDNGHGTHVAGTIAARANGTGIVGVAPGVRLIPVKVLDKNGAGPVSDILRGMVWAVEHGAQVLNLSLGAPKTSKSEERVVRAIYQRGVTIIGSAGNGGPGPDTESYPAGYPEVIAVAASDRQDHVAEFSSRGHAIAFVAPGVDIVSTFLNNGYAKAAGTSMASPHVTGLAALAIASGARGPEAVRQALSRAASRLCPDGQCAGADEQGAGMIDAREIVGAAAPGGRKF